LCLIENFPPEKINIHDYCKNKSVVFVGLPGAFTPTCSNKQIPDYMEKQEALREAGVDEVIVMAVHDGAVMSAWAKNQETDQSMLTFLGDPFSELTKALDLELTHPGPIGKLGHGRCKRFAMHVVDSEIKALNISEAPDDPTGEDDHAHANSLADAIIATMK